MSRLRFPPRWIGLAAILQNRVHHASIRPQRRPVSRGVCLLLCRQLADKLAYAFRSRWSWQHRIYRPLRAHGRLSQSARNGELRGLGHAVVDHLRGNLDRTLARNKNDAAPVALLHPGQKCRLRRTPLRTFVSKK